MKLTTKAAPVPTEAEGEFITGAEAEKFSTLSLKTLQRHQAAGRDTGVRKIGRRLVVHLETLRRFLAGSTDTEH